MFKSSTDKHLKQVEKDMKRKATEEMKRKRKETKYAKSNDNTMQAHIGTMHDMMVVQVSMISIKTFLVNFLKT